MVHAPFQRGSVVLCDGKYGVVWASSDGRIDLIPVVGADDRRANDVELTDVERLDAGIPVRGAVLRPADRLSVPAARQTPVGVLQGQVNCRLTRAMIRCSADAVVHDRWAADPGHRRKAAVPGAQISRAGRRVVCPA